MSNVVEKTIEVVGHNESGGNYDSINRSDVISIGLFNWYGARALNIARQIVNTDPQGSQNALTGASRDLYADIVSGNNNVWNNYRPGQSSDDIQALERFLNLDASKSVQNLQATNDANGYISQAKARGITETNAQVYFADLYNQSPRQAGNIVTAIKNAGLPLTAENLHAYAMKNPVMSQYSTRRNYTWNQLNGWDGSEIVTPPVNPPNPNGGDGTAGNIPPYQSNVADYLLITNGVIISYSTTNPGGTVYIPNGNNMYIPMSKGGDFNG